MVRVMSPALVALACVVGFSSAMRWDYVQTDPQGGRCDPVGGALDELRPDGAGPWENGCKTACAAVGAKFCMYDYVAGGCAHAPACDSVVLPSEDSIPRRLYNVFSPAANSCGDAVRDAGEGCDDGNTRDGDGCSAACVVEPGFACLGGTPLAPDTCVPGGEQYSSGGFAADEALQWLPSVPQPAGPAATATGAVEFGTAYARIVGAGRGMRLAQSNSSVAEAARAVTFTERVLPAAGALSATSQLSYWFRAQRRPRAVGAALVVTMIECPAAPAACSAALDPAQADAATDPRYFRVCVSKADAWGRGCDVHADAAEGEWRRHDWNVAARFRAKYGAAAAVPARVKLQFATYGGAMEHTYDHDTFEGGPGSSDDWVSRSGINPAIKCNTPTADDAPYAGQCALYMSGLGGRNFEAWNSGHEPKQSHGGFLVSDYPILCVAVKKKYADTPISMLWGIRSLLKERRSSGEVYYRRTSTWRAVDFSTCNAPAADRSTACDWNYTPYAATIDVAATPALEWSHQCVDIEKELNTNIGEGFHSIYSMIWHSCNKNTKGPRQTNYGRSKFWIDDFVIKSRPVVDDAEVWVDGVEVVEVGGAPQTKSCAVLEASARSSPAGKFVKAQVGTQPYETTTVGTQIVRVDPATLVVQGSKLFATYNSPAEREKAAQYVRDTAEGTVVLAASNDVASPARVLLDDDFNGADNWRTAHLVPSIVVTPKDEGRSSAEYNMALRRPVHASTSVYERDFARWIVDGVRSCYDRYRQYLRSAPEAHPWVRIDLMQGRAGSTPPQIKRVVVYRRSNLGETDTFVKSGVIVSAGNNRDDWQQNTRCGGAASVLSMKAADVTDWGNSVECNVQARYVFVTGNWASNSHMHLCEVEVIGTAGALTGVHATSDWSMLNRQQGFTPVSDIGSPTDAAVSVTAARALTHVPGAEAGSLAFNFGPTDAVLVTAPKFRSDKLCGRQASPARDGSDDFHSTCNPMDTHSGCCDMSRTSYGYCGNSPKHCDCKGCIDQRAYPMTELRAIADAHVDSQNPTQNSGAGLEIKFGSKSGETHQRRAYFRFDTSLLASDKTVSGAMLKMYTTSKNTGRWRIFPVTEAWDESTITYNNQPAYDTSKTLFYTYDRPQTGWSTTHDLRYERGNYGGARFAEVVQGWIDNPATNFGLVIVAIHGSDDTTVKTKEYGDDNSFAARLEVQYDYDVTSDAGQVPIEQAVKFTASTADVISTVTTPGGFADCATLCYRTTGCAAWRFSQTVQTCDTLRATTGSETNFLHTSGRPLLWQAGMDGIAIGKEWVIESDFKLPLKRGGQELYTLSGTHNGLNAHAACKRGCTFTADTSYDGKVIRTVSANSQDACCTLCNLEETCRAFTFDASQNCHLREEVGAATSSVGHVSGQNSEVELGLVKDGEFKAWNLTDVFKLETAQVGTKSLAAGWHRLSIVTYKDSGSAPNGRQIFHIDGATFADHEHGSYVGSVDFAITEGVYSIGNHRDAARVAGQRKPWGPMQAFRAYEKKFEHPGFLKRYFPWRAHTEGTIRRGNWRYVDGTLRTVDEVYGPYQWWMARCEDRVNPSYASLYRSPQATDRLGTYLEYDNAEARQWEDVSIATRIFQQNTNRGIGLLFRYQDEKNHYRFSLESDGYGCLDFEKRVDGITTSLKTVNHRADASVYQMTLREWVDLRVDVEGNTFRAYANERLILEATDLSPGPLTSGSVALWTWMSRDARFEYLRVTELTSTTTSLRTADESLKSALADVGVTHSASAGDGGSWTAIGTKGTVATRLGAQVRRMDNGTAASRFWSGCAKTTRSVVENSPVDLRLGGALRSFSGTRTNGVAAYTTDYRVASVTSKGQPVNATGTVGAARHIFAVDPQTGEMRVQHAQVNFEQHSEFSVQVAARESGYDSGWFDMRSQRGEDSFKQMQHGIDDFPAEQLSVRLLVRAYDGPNRGFVFHGTGAAMATDYYDHHNAYGGVLFAYDQDSLRLWAPANPDDFTKCYKDGGGSPSNCNQQWSHQYLQPSIIRVGFAFGGEMNNNGYLEELRHAQASANAQVRMQVKKDRAPSYDSGWFRLRAEAGAAAFAEHFHRLGAVPGRVKVVARAIDGPNKGFVFEGVGAQQADDDTWRQPYAGVMYGYSKDRVRVWVPASNTQTRSMSRGFIIATDPGWGGGVNPQQSKEADVRIMAWRDDQDPDFDSGWVEMASNAVNDYMEVAHGLGNLPGHVQAIWRNARGRIVMAGYDGWGGNRENQASSTALVRVRAWKQFAALESTQSVDVAVTDVNEAPVTSDIATRLPEDTVAGTFVATVKGQDDDANTKLTYKIIGGNTDGDFNITSAGAGAGTVLVGKPLDFERTSMYALKVRVSDGLLEAIATVTVAILNRNDRPVIDDATVSILEESAVNTLVGTPINGTDGDLDQTILFKIVSGNVDDAFKISGCGGQLRVANPVVDYEKLKKYTLTVSLTDDGVPPLNDTATVVVNVLNKNDRPEFEDQERFVVENSPIGAAVGAPLVVDDPDKDVLTFEIEFDDAGGLFDIENSTGQVVMARYGPDYELPSLSPEYTLVVKVTDHGNPPLSNEARVTIKVNNTNDAPVLPAAVRYIAEDINMTYARALDDGVAQVEDAETGEDDVDAAAAMSTTAPPQPALAPAARNVGPKIMGTDQDSRKCIGDEAIWCDDVLSYSILGDSIFTITKDGQLQLDNTHWLNFEFRSEYALTVRAADKFGAAVNTTVLVKVQDMNDPPVMTPGTLRIPENLAAGTELQVLNGTDEDRLACLSGDEASDLSCPSVTYTIESGNTGSTFAIDSQTGMLSVKIASIDFEAVSSYDLVITATDDGSPPLVASAPYHIDVLDVNDPPLPQCNTSLPQQWELRPASNGMFQAIADPDKVDGISIFDLGRPATAQLCQDACSALPACKVYTFFRSSYFRAQWRGRCFGRSAAAIDSFNTEDETVVSGVRVTPCQLFFISENTDADISVGQPLVADDPDKNTVQMMIESGNVGSALKVYKNGQLAVQNTAALDFENVTDNTIKLTVLAKDDGTPPKHSSFPVHVRLIDVNEKPVLDPTSRSRTVVRIAESGDNIGAPLVAVDPDQGAVLSYTMDSIKSLGAVKPAGQINYFALNASTGQLSVANAFSAGIMDETPFEIRVRVSDGMLHTTDTVRVEVENANIQPKIDDHALTLAETIDAQGINRFVYKVPVTDGNTEQTHTWKLLFGLEDSTTFDGSGMFEIDATSGVISLLLDKHLDFESVPRFVLTVLVEDVTDDGMGQLTDSAKITVNVQDVNEPPVISNTTLYIDENTGAGNSPLTLDGLDGMIACHDDDKDALEFTILSGNVASSFNLQKHGDDSFKLVVAPGKVLDHESLSEFHVAVQASDGTLRGTGFIHIVINDVNEPPVVVNATLSVLENSPRDITIDRVNFTDQDEQDTATFSIFSGDAAGFFSIDPLTGWLSVSKEGLDFEAQPFFDLVVRATDRSKSFGDGTIRVYLVDTNDLTIDTVGVVSTGGKLMKTKGGEQISLRGTNFGQAVQSVEANYSSASGRLYTASGCAVHAAGEIRCLSVPGSGAGPYIWHVTVRSAPTPYSVGVWSTTSQEGTAYTSPTISKLVGHVGMPTAGGATITIEGDNFGPLNTEVKVTFLPDEVRPGRSEFFATNCQVVTATTKEKITCVSPEGAGGRLKWQVVVDGQSSSFTQPVSNPSNFALPSITTLDNSRLFVTRGNEKVAVTGSNFGPFDGYTIEAVYGNCSAGVNSNKIKRHDGTDCYIAPCKLTRAHTHVECTTMPGIGANQHWRLRVAPTVGAEQRSVALSINATSYRQPVVRAVQGQGARNANTEGGQQIVLLGTDFGPSGTVIKTVYGRGGAATYSGVACEVTTPHTAVECLTAPGTGNNHIWSIELGEQKSVPCFATPTHYGTPFVSTITGAGAQDAVTPGGETIVIKGGNFGPASLNNLQSVTYGQTGKEFVAKSCKITVDHETVVCNTAVGGGFKLKWIVNVDEQASTQPTTYYALPIVESLSGKGSKDARSLGNDTVVIHGQNFATDALLESVTYGWSGTEYTCHSAKLQEDHTAIACETQAGWGRELKWLVTVAGQTSLLAEKVVSNYADPFINSISPQNGPTGGGLTVELDGTNFGPFGVPTVVFGEQQVPIDRHAVCDAATVAGTDILACTKLDLARHIIKFRLPEGFGKFKDVKLTLGDGGAQIVSKPVKFRYDPPRIEKLVVKRIPNAMSKLELQAYGVGFGVELDLRTRERTAAMLIDGVVTSTERGCNDCFTHRLVKVLYDRGAAISSTVTGTIQMVVGDPAFFIDLEAGTPLAKLSKEQRAVKLSQALAKEANNAQASNVFNFSHFSPTIVSMKTADGQVPVPLTQGGEHLVVVGLSFGERPLVKVGGAACPPVDPLVPVEYTDDACKNQNATGQDSAQMCEQRITCTVPPGFGRMEVIVTLGGMSSEAEWLTYEPPSLEISQLHLGTTGGMLSLIGTSLGTSGVVRLLSRYDSEVLNITGHAHTSMNVTIPPGIGSGHTFELTLMPPAEAVQASVELDPARYLREYTTEKPGKPVVGVTNTWAFTYDVPAVSSVVGDFGADCELVARFDDATVGMPQGTVSFTEGIHHTIAINVTLGGLEDAALAPQGNQLHVHVQPATGALGACKAAGGHYDPQAVEFAARCDAFSAATFDDQDPTFDNTSNATLAPGRPTYQSRMDAGCFYAGDLSAKHGALFGPIVQGRASLDGTGTLKLHELVGRSIVLHKGDGARWACAEIAIRAGKEASCTRQPFARSDGKTVLELSGRNFGAPGVAHKSHADTTPVVALGQGRCFVQAWTHDQITCRMGTAPAERLTAEGKALPLGVIVGDLVGSYAKVVQEIAQLRYLPPKLLSASPDHGPTRGGVLITVIGDDLGVNNETAHRLGLNRITSSGDDPRRPQVLDNPCGAKHRNSDGLLVGCIAAESFTHTGFQFMLPATDGSALVTNLRAVVGRQAADEALAFAYDPPEISSVLPASGPTSGFRNGQIFLLTVKGKNFGTTDSIEVLIGKPELFDAVPCGHPFKKCITHACPASGKIVPPCFAMPLDLSKRHETIEVFPGSGYGKDLAVVVRLRASAEKLNTMDNWINSNSHPYKYDPPHVTRVSPDPSDAFGDEFTSNAEEYKVEADAVQERMDAMSAQPESPERTAAMASLNEEMASTRHKLHMCDGGRCRGKRITLHGENFGEVSSPLWITLNDANCSEPTWRNPRGRPYLECMAPPTAVGFVNITVHVAGQTVSYADHEEKLLRACEPGYYGQFGEFCLECPPGAECESEYSVLNRTFSEPVAKQHWWRMEPELDDPDARQCHFDRQNRPEGYGECYYFVPCEPKESCLGLNFCEVGYAGMRCTDCAKGYFRRTGECVPCPDCPLCIVLLFIGVGVVCGTAGYILSRKNIELGIVAIGVDYFQVLSMLARTKVAWPKAVVELYYWLSAFNLNLELLAPECSYDISYDQKWLFIEMLPVGLIGIFLLVHFSKVFHKKFIQKRTAKIHSHGHRVVGFSLMCFYFLYLYLTRTTLEIWNCQETDPPDGHEYMQAVFVKCGEPGGLQQRLLPWSIIFFFGYTLAYPGIVALILWRGKNKVQEDQLLRAKGTGQTRATNPNCHDFRKRYKDIYYRFKPQFYYWTLVIIFRKFCIAAAALMFRKTPAFQLAIMQLVMFTSYALQVRNNPYMSEAEKPMVVLRYQERLANNAVLNLASGVAGAFASQQAGKGGVGHGRKKLNLGSQSTIDAAREAHADRPKVAYFWNYNTVEAVLLCCGVLVTLAGVMFQSGKLESQPQTADILAYAVLTIIVLSIIYFFTVLFTEIAIGLGYKCNLGCLGDSSKPQGASAATADEERQLELRMKKMERHVSKNAFGSSGRMRSETATALNPDELIDDEDMEMPAQMNPMHADVSAQNELVGNLQQAAQNEKQMAETIERLQKELLMAKKSATASQLAGYGGGSRASLRGGSSQRMTRGNSARNLGGSRGHSSAKRVRKEVGGGQSDRTQKPTARPTRALSVEEASADVV
eukprot:g675.t1